MNSKSAGLHEKWKELYEGVDEELRDHMDGLFLNFHVLKFVDEATASSQEIEDEEAEEEEDQVEEKVEEETKQSDNNK